MRKPPVSLLSFQDFFSQLMPCFAENCKSVIIDYSYAVNGAHMDCETFLNRFFLLDKHEPLPAGIRLHLLHCKKCSKLVARMIAAESIPQRVLHTPIANGDRMLNTAMTAIYQLNRHHGGIRRQERPTLWAWFTAGLFLIVGFVILPFSDIGRIELNRFGDSFCIPFALLCAGSIVAYSAIFLAKNLVFFSEKFKVPR